MQCLVAVSMAVRIAVRVAPPWFAASLIEEKSKLAIGVANRLRELCARIGNRTNVLDPSRGRLQVCEVRGDEILVAGGWGLGFLGTCEVVASRIEALPEDVVADMGTGVVQSERVV
jgi:hypothetical protein